jgi:hypothetical protein
VRPTWRDFNIGRNCSRRFDIAVELICNIGSFRAILLWRFCFYEIFLFFCFAFHGKMTPQGVNMKTTNYIFLLALCPVCMDAYGNGAANVYGDANNAAPIVQYRRTVTVYPSGAGGTANMPGRPAGGVAPGGVAPGGVAVNGGGVDAHGRSSGDMAVPGGGDVYYYNSYNNNNAGGGYADGQWHDPAVVSGAHAHDGRADGVVFTESGHGGGAWDAAGGRAAYSGHDSSGGATGWYVGGSFFYNLALFENRYSTDGVFNASDPYAVDKFTAGQFGLHGAVGRKIADNWRLEGEVGWFGTYSEQSAGVEFKISAPYLTANAIYDFDMNDWGGFYIGAGLGLAMPMTEFHGSAIFLGDSGAHRAVSLMGGVMLGVSLPIAEQFYLDIRYRLSAYDAGENTRQWQDTNNVVHDFTSETGLVLNNTLSAGIRYEF